MRHGKTISRESALSVLNEEDKKLLEEARLRMEADERKWRGLHNITDTENTLAEQEFKKAIIDTGPKKKAWRIENTPISRRMFKLGFVLALRRI